jgi:hypothetical protein
MIIMFNPVLGDKNDEFVEIYNAGASSTNINGWKLSGGISFTLSNVTLGASGTLVIAKSITNLVAKYTNLVGGINATGNYSGTLGDHGDRLTLSTGSGIVVDEVIYRDGGRWGRWSDGGGASLELIGPRSDHRLAPSWTDSDSPTNTSWTTISTTGLVQLGDGKAESRKALEISLLGAGECLIDNVSVIPQGSSERIVNGDFESGTTGWTFDGDYDLSAWRVHVYLRGGARGLRCEPNRQFLEYRGANRRDLHDQRQR